MSNQVQESKNNGPEPIDLMIYLKDYLQILQRMWKRIVALIVLLAIICYVRATVQYQPYYTASATFTINMYQQGKNGEIINSSFFDNSTAEQMATTFPYILTSGVLQRQVAQTLGMSSVPGTIRASVLKDTNLLTISVTDVDAERAYRTVHAVVETYPTLSEVIVGKVNMEMLDETGIPPYPDNAKDVKGAVAKGALAGLALGLLWAALVMFTRKTVRRPDDCPRMVNKKCLGSVPAIAMKKRSRKTEQHLNIMDEKASADFKEAFRMIRNKIEQSARANGIKSILVTSTLGAEGKSTIAVNIALALAQEDKKVALVDCDLRNPSDSKVLGVEVTKGLADCLRGEATLNECILTESELKLPDEMEITFIPGGDAVEDASLLLENKKMYQIIKALEKNMDYVILDSAPIGLLTDAGILAQYVDGAVYVIKNDFAKTDHILEGMEHLTDGKAYIMGCILNGYS